MMAQETSILSLKQHRESGQIGLQQKRVLSYLNKCPHGLSNNDLSYHLGIKISSITPRVNELRHQGLVIGVGTKICRYTRRKVKVWKTVANSTIHEVDNYFHEERRNEDE